MEYVLAFLFADLAGFTALADAHGDLGAVDCASRFGEIARGACVGSARFVKTIGDAVMVVAEAGQDAVRTGLALSRNVGAESDFPAVRIGLHEGSAIERDGDYFGAAVNLASRVASHAAQDEMLCTQPIASHAARITDAEIVGLGPVRFKNLVEPVEIFEIRDRHRSPQDTVVDPVCRMRVDPASAAGRLLHQETTYYFCSLDCAGKFAQQPASFTSR